MKVSIIYDNLSISTKLNKGIKVRELITNLKSSQALKQLFKRENEVKLMDEKYNFIDDDEFLQVGGDNQNEKKFYLIVRNLFREKIMTEMSPKLEIDELISKVTDAKTKLKKVKPGKRTSLGNDHRIQLIQQLANNFSQLPNIPGLQNRVNEINHFTNLLRTMINDELINVEVTGVNRVAQPSQPVVPDEQLLNQLKDMGFPEENCRRALVLARNNISRATDLLINDELDYINNEA
jgi:uncharacterized UBP type Zn finger protein